MGLSKNSACLRIYNRTRQEQTVGIQHWQPSKWRYEEASSICWSLSPVSEPMGSKRDRENWGKISAGRADEAIENSVCKSKQKPRFKSQMRVLFDSKSRCFYAPVPWIRANGSEQETRVQKNRTDRIKAAYPSWVDRKRCYWLLCTVDGWGVYCNVSIISNQGD